MSRIPREVTNAGRQSEERRTKKRRLLLGLLLILMSLLPLGWGFYQMSIWNPEPTPAEFSTVAFILGLVLFVAGFAMSIFAFSHLFAMGHNDRKDF